MAAIGPPTRSGSRTVWPADVHLIGKEIVRQHAIYWPAFLLAADLPLPRRVVSHGWWLMDGAKMSKSKGNVVRPRDYIALFGLDALRYFVFREMVFGQDADFTDEAILTRYNADLANDFGNLVSRTTTLIQRFCENKVPAPDSSCARASPSRISVPTPTTSSVASKDRYVVSVERRAARHLGTDWRRQPLYRVARAVEARQERHRPARVEHALYVGRRRADDDRRIVRGRLSRTPPNGRWRMLGVTPQKTSWTTLASGTAEAGNQLGTISPLFPRIEHSVEELRTDGCRYRTRAPWRSNRPPTPAPAPSAAAAAPPARRAPAAAAAAPKARFRSTIS